MGQLFLALVSKPTMSSYPSVFVALRYYVKLLREETLILPKTSACSSPFTHNSAWLLASRAMSDICWFCWPNKVDRSTALANAAAPSACK